MRRQRTGVFWAGAMLLVLFGPAGSSADVLIDFETLPGGASPVPWDPVSASYAGWGVTFTSYDVDGMPQFNNGYPPAGFFALASSCTYPTGHNLVAHFIPGVHEVSAAVMTAEGSTVTMVAKDMLGNPIDSDTSAAAPAGLWVGTLSVSAAAPIASVEWWPSLASGVVGIDGLAYGPVPEPATLALLGLGAGGLMARRLRRRGATASRPA